MKKLMQYGWTGYVYETTYYHTDALGSIYGRTDEDGFLFEGMEYDIYGKPVIEHYDDPSQLRSPNRYLFTGREYHSATELYYYRARWYSPTLARFLQRDPAGFDILLSLYTYVGNNPVAHKDPQGLWWCDNLCKKTDKRKLVGVKIWLIPFGMTYETAEWARSWIKFFSHFASVGEVLTLYFAAHNLLACKRRGVYIYTIFTYKECECESCWIFWERLNWVAKEDVHKYDDPHKLPHGATLYTIAKRAHTAKSAFKAHLKELGWDATNTDYIDKFENKLFPKVFPIEK